MIKHILWKSKHMIFSFGKNVSICSFSNKNVDYKKSYTPYYTSKVILIESYTISGENNGDRNIILYFDYILHSCWEMWLSIYHISMKFAYHYKIKTLTFIFLLARGQIKINLLLLNSL